jgi:hypothetical protein
MTNAFKVATLKAFAVVLVSFVPAIAGSFQTITDFNVLGGDALPTSLNFGTDGTLYT